jgi:hypothetical protein
MCIKRVYIAVDRISYSFILLFQLQKSFSFFCALSCRHWLPTQPDATMPFCFGGTSYSFFLTYTCPRLSWDKGATVRLGKVYTNWNLKVLPLSKSPNPCMRNEFLVGKSFLFHKFSSRVTQLKKMGKHASNMRSTKNFTRIPEPLGIVWDIRENKWRISNKRPKTSRSLLLY